MEREGLCTISKTLLAFTVLLIPVKMNRFLEHPQSVRDGPDVVTDPLLVERSCPTRFLSFLPPHISLQSIMLEKPSLRK